MHSNSEIAIVQLLVSWFKIHTWFAIINPMIANHRAGHALMKSPSFVFGASLISKCVCFRLQQAVMTEEFPTKTTCTSIECSMSENQVQSLFSWLNQSDEKFALALAPGFFGFYAHIGCLKALDEAGLLENKVSFIGGASAGALVGGMYAAGLSINEMIDTVTKLTRSDFWDFPGVGGVLRGRAFENLVRNCLPKNVNLFDQCPIKLGVTAYSLSGLETKCIREGDIAIALRASCTFPLLFQPVWHTEGVLMDGGVHDIAGLWAIPDGGEEYRRILNVSFGTGPFINQVVPPSKFPCPTHPRIAQKEIVSLVLCGLPRPHPFAMHKGTSAIDAAYMLVKNALHKTLVRADEADHWIVPTSAISSKI